MLIPVRFYACEGSLVIPDAEIVCQAAAEHNCTVRFKYPAVDDSHRRTHGQNCVIIPADQKASDIRSSLHEGLGFRAPYSGTGREGDTAKSGDHVMFKATQLKSTGNQFYKDKDYTAAVEMYTGALELLPDKATIDSSPMYISVWQNILTNMCNAFVHLERWQDIIEPATDVIGAIANLETIYQRRAVWARGRAYEHLGRMRLAAQDYNSLYRVASGPHRLQDVATVMDIVAALRRTEVSLDNPRGTVKWQQVKPLRGAATPPPRFLHLAALDAATRRIYVHGGDASSDPLGQDFLRDVWCFDCATDSWHEVQTRHSPALKDHAGVIYNGVLVVFGGSVPRWHGPDGRVINTSRNLVQLHLKSGQWSKLSPKGATPQPRNCHSAVLYDGKMWIFGGIRDTDVLLPNGTPSTELNDVWSYDLVQGVWREEHSGAGDIDTVPMVRHHQCCWVAKDEMWIFGGERPGSIGRCSHSCHVLHIFADLSPPLWAVPATP